MLPERSTDEHARRTMRANRRRDTKPEFAVRRRLHARGLRYRVDFRLAPPLCTRADIVFTRLRIAVFIDGCFWHGWPMHAIAPKRNSDYWHPRIARNRERDGETDAKLVSRGWTVLRFWEHDDAEDVATVIEATVRAAR